MNYWLTHFCFVFATVCAWVLKKTRKTCVWRRRSWKESKRWKQNAKRLDVPVLTDWLMWSKRQLRWADSTLPCAILQFNITLFISNYQNRESVLHYQEPIFNSWALDKVVYNALLMPFFILVKIMELQVCNCRISSCFGICSGFQECELFY